MCVCGVSLMMLGVMRLLSSSMLVVVSVFIVFSVRRLGLLGLVFSSVILFVVMLCFCVVLYCCGGLILCCCLVVVGG